MAKEKKRYTAEMLRRCIWRGLGALKAAAIPELMGVIPGIGRDSVKKAVRSMEIHGYVAKNGKKTRWGMQYAHTYKKRLFPQLPPVCERCGEPFSAKICDPSLKEKKKQREREKVAAPPAYVPAEIDPATWHKIPAEITKRLELALNDEEVAHDAA